jgi:hypothetical protein
VEVAIPTNCFRTYVIYSPKIEGRVVKELKIPLNEVGTVIGGFNICHLQIKKRRI